MGFQPAPATLPCHRRRVLRKIVCVRLLSSQVARGCNLIPRVDGVRPLVWLEAKRDISVGEELCFDYGASYRWDTPGSAGGPVRSK